MTRRRAGELVCWLLIGVGGALFVWAVGYWLLTLLAAAMMPPLP